MFRWCGEGRPTWNGLIWSSVSIKAQTIRNILSVNFFIYSKHVVEQKKWFIWIKTLQLLSPKKISLKIHCSNLSQPYKNFWYLNIYVQLLSEVEFLYQICYIRFSFGYLRKQPTNPLFTDCRFPEKLAWIIMQFSLQLTETLKGETCN